MARRQSGTGVTDTRPRLINHRVYEDFDPKIDTKEDGGAQIVVFHVSGFLKEQITITSEHNNIRVQGQRQLLNKKWSRFNTLLPVPANCEVTKILAKYHSGILTITMPKEVTTTTMPPTTVKTVEKRTQENINETPTKAIENRAVPPPASEPNQTKDETGTPAVEKTSQKTISEEQKAKSNLGGIPQKVMNEPKAQSGHGAEGLAKQKATSSETKMLGSADSQQLSNEPKAQKGLDVSSSAQTNADKKKTTHEIITKPEGGDQVVDQNPGKDKVSTKNEKESTEASTAIIAAASKALDDVKKNVQKFGSDAANTKEEASNATNGNKMGINYIAETAKQTMANVVKRLNDDDSQMLINVGAAVMVLVAFGAYISSGNFQSSTDDKN